MNVPSLVPLFQEARPYRRCARCLLDTVGPHDITFDADGVCNYCHEYDAAGVRWAQAVEGGAERLRRAVAGIKAAGVGRRYDCILGLSGGMDSSYIAHLAMVHGLRPLIVHLDNSWDAELAVKNIESIIQRTGFDYYNHVVEWEEFKDMQMAYLRASVIDIEVVSDQAIFAILHIVADRLGVRHILFGDNPQSERVMPRGWNYRKNDLANMKAIHRRFGTRRLRSYPLMGLYDLDWYRKIAGINYVSLLHHAPAGAGEMVATLGTEFGWRDYRWKHCESVFTRFYQGYILPKKFGVDKRKAHLSDLVLSGQITRDEAIARLEEPYYTDEELREDYDFVIRKFGLTAAGFEELMSLPPVPHESFPQDAVGFVWRMKLRAWRVWSSFGGLCKEGGRQILGRRHWTSLRHAWMRRLESDLDRRLGL